MLKNNIERPAGHPVKSSRGGKRGGAGRKPLDPSLIKRPVSFRLAPYLKDWLDAQDTSSTELVENALIKQYKIKTGGKT